MATPDITVMGAGIFGQSIAYTCARRGAKVRLIDPKGAGSGASGGTVGALAPHTPERWDTTKEFQFQSLIMAEDFWADIDARSGSDSGYGRIGRLQPIADDHTLNLARERIGQAAELWQGKANWQVRPASDFGDWKPDTPTGLLVHDTLSGRIDPGRAINSISEALETLGVHVEPDGDPSGKTIWATGYKGLLALSEEFATTVGNGVKGQSALLRYDAGDVPQIFTGGVHFVPHNNGTVSIGSTSERYFDAPNETDAQLDDLVERGRNLMPLLKDAPVLVEWAAVRPRAKTRAPMLGAYPGKPDQFIANGGFKIGFGMAPKVAETMADLVLEGIDIIPQNFRIEDNL
ncbi:MAG: NAD(P)/FAD-dependent oxidoreductase [Paracoccaceae bacterium]